MCAVTVRSSDSRMERRNPFSCNERTRAASLGRFCTGDSTRRASLRLVDAHSWLLVARRDNLLQLDKLERPWDYRIGDSTCGKNHTIDRQLTPPSHTTGSRQETHSPHHKTPASHRWSLSRRYQRAPRPAPGSSRRSPTGSPQRWEGEEDGLGEQEETGEGEVGGERGTGANDQDSE